MWTPAKVVMLPTNQKAQIGTNIISLYQQEAIIGGIDHNNKLGYGQKICESTIKMQDQHLYIVSDEEIKEDDYVLLPNTITQRMSNSDMIDYLSSDSLATKKIIATTDTSLFINGTLSYPYEESTAICKLPQPSQSFIDKYIESYNKGNVITDVMVEYDLMYLNKRLGGTWQPFPDEFIEVHEKKYVLKINPDNTINIQMKKDSWTREELTDRCKKILWDYIKYEDKLKGTDYFGGISITFEKYENTNIDKWIEQNL
jgi:hypothetical protein